MLKERIINYSKKIGIDLIGFCDSEVSSILKEKLILQKKLGFACEFQHGSIEDKTNPKLLLNNCKTIIAIGMSHTHECDKLKSLNNDEVYFSSSSWGMDYHIVMKNKMEQLCNFIKDNISDFDYKIICDTSPLCDRTIAYKAGLGFFGKNNLLINPEYGSSIFLGAILTNLDLEYDLPLKLKCSDVCNKCIDNCPTKALSELGILDANKCLSYLTQKKELTFDEEKILNNCIYGCDICLNVCPYNKVSNDLHKEFAPSSLEFINVREYESLSNKKFREKYGAIAGSWRGAKIINRNIKIYREKLK